MAEAPSIEELGPLIGDSAALDEPSETTDYDTSAGFEEAAMSALGSRAKVTALRDALDAYLAEKGISPAAVGESEPDGDDALGSVGDLGDESDY